MSLTYLTTAELAEKIKYDARTIRNALKDSVLLEGRALHPSVRRPQNPVHMGTHRSRHGENAIRFCDSPQQRRVVVLWVVFA